MRLPDVALADHDTRVVNRLGKVDVLADDSLQATLHELVQVQTEDVIQLPLALLEQAELDDSADESIALELSARAQNLWASSPRHIESGPGNI